MPRVIRIQDLKYIYEKIIEMIVYKSNLKSNLFKQYFSNRLCNYQKFVTELVGNRCKKNSKQETHLQYILVHANAEMPAAVCEAQSAAAYCYAAVAVGHCYAPVAMLLPPAA